MTIVEVINLRIVEYSDKKNALEKEALALQQQINGLTQKFGGVNRQLLIVIGALESNKEILDDFKKIKQEPKK